MPAGLLIKPCWVTHLTFSLQISGVNWLVKIPNSSTTFESYINKPNSIMEIKQLLTNELKGVFFYLKNNKSPGYDDISFKMF